MCLKGEHAMQNNSEKAFSVCACPVRRICSAENKDWVLARTIPGYRIPDKVIAYLRAGTHYLACPGIYEHPYRPDIRLGGPEYYTDGHFYWDRDTWKYVLKYGFTLPPEFIDHVMSDSGTAFIDAAIDKSKLWCSAIKSFKKKQGFRCFLPNSEERCNQCEG